MPKEEEFVVEEEVYIPQTLEEAIERYPYLGEYISKIEAETGIKTQYLLTLQKALQRVVPLSIIYPVGGPVFIHILVKSKEEKEYRVLEPPITPRLRRILDLIELRLIEIADRVKPPKDDLELKKFLYNFVNALLTTTRGKPGIYVSPEEKRYIIYYVLRDKVGNGLLEPIMRDPYIEDIHGVGLGNIYVTHTIFGLLKTNLVFEEDIELNKFLVQIAERAKRPITHKNPIVDAIMPDGSRLNIIYGRDISLKGSSFTIRKFTKKPISIIQLVKWGTFTPELAAYLWLAFEFGMNVFFCGETASGKTTSLKACIAFIRPDAKIYSVEETPEVFCPHECWQRVIGKPQKEPGEGGVDMFDLLKAALRSRPDYIIIGEIRGKEGHIAFQAMQTGHPVASTFHAGSIKQVIQRLTGEPINVPLPFIDNLNIVVIQRTLRKEGVLLRRVVSVVEIERYIAETNSVMTREVFSYSPALDLLRFRGRFNSYILEQKIAPIMGFEDPRLIYAELDRRAKIIAEMVRRNITDYFQAWEIFKKYYYYGLDGLPFRIE